MKKIILVSFLVLLFVSACGVKGAPMPRRDEMFIRPSEVKKVQIKKALNEESEQKKMMRKKEKR